MWCPQLTREPPGRDDGGAACRGDGPSHPWNPATAGFAPGPPVLMPRQVSEPPCQPGLLESRASRPPNGTWEMHAVGRALGPTPHCHAGPRKHVAVPKGPRRAHRRRGLTWAPAFRTHAEDHARGLGFSSPTPAMVALAAADRKGTSLLLGTTVTSKEPTRALPQDASPGVRRSQASACRTSEERGSGSRARSVCLRPGWETEAAVRGRAVRKQVRPGSWAGPGVLLLDKNCSASDTATR